MINDIPFAPPIPVEQISTVRLPYSSFYESGNNGQWVEPEMFQIAYTGKWANYRELFPHPDFVDGKRAGINIDIEIRWQTHLYLDGVAILPYAHAHDEQITRLIEIPHPKQYDSWMQVYQQLKAEALEWVSHVRVPLYQALLLHDVDREILGEIARMEYFKYSAHSGYEALSITTREIAHRRGWFTNKPPRSGKEDVEAMSRLLQTLVARGFLLEQGEEYAIAGRLHWKQRTPFPIWGQQPEALVLLHIDQLSFYATIFGVERSKMLVARWKKAALSHPGPVFILCQQEKGTALLAEEQAEIFALEYQRPLVAVLTPRNDSWWTSIDHLCMLAGCLGIVRMRLGGIWTPMIQPLAQRSVINIKNALAQHRFSAELDSELCGGLHEVGDGRSCVCDET